MNEFLVLFLFILSILLLLTGLLWILVPARYGLPPVPTGLNRIRKALKLVNLQPDEVLYDLGSGDGRVLIIAAREFGAWAVGIEIGPVQRAVSWVKVLRVGIQHKVRIEAGDFYRADLHAADVVFVYATSKEVRKLAAHLEKQMKPGSRLVSISADFPEWEPSAFDERELIFVYEMPPKRGSLMTYLLKKAV
ncbi:MAG TPA: class I SAM-dependent methyltransferase [Anaerolineales bacterium]|nr:class I SAM-dependent methyltransferase [Anaerolineales bacterium]